MALWYSNTKKLRQELVERSKPGWAKGWKPHSKERGNVRIRSGGRSYGIG